MLTTLCLAFFVAAPTAATPDTIDVRVGSPLINWRLERPYTSRFEVWQIDGKDSTRLDGGLNVVTHRNGKLLLRSDAPPAPTQTTMFDLRTLAHGDDTTAFYGPMADILVEFLPRRLNVVYRVRLRFDGATALETHLYETRVRADGVWVVEDHDAATGRLASRLWLIDKPPYMLRWYFYDAPKAGSVIHARQTLAQ